MTPTTTRIGRLGWMFGIGFAIVIGHLWLLMVHDHEAWARRSHANRWSFRAVPSQRGSLHDRFGERLVVDVPTTQFTLHYQRFRQRHPVGAAVHAATRLASLHAATQGTVYDYTDGVLGAAAAARDVLATPVAVLRPGVLEKEIAAELRVAITTVLAHASGRSRKEVNAALRGAAQAERGCIGDVLGVHADELLAAFGQSFQRLCELDADLARLARDRAERREQPIDEQPGLIGTLQQLRLASWAQARVHWEANGVMQTGSPIESVRRVFADQVPFAMAAALRIGAERHPGLEVSPACSREQASDLGATLPVLLGAVVELDRAVPDARWLERYRRRELPPEWLDDMVPSGIVDTEAARDELKGELEETFERELRRRERRGVNGIEAAFDGELMGRLGMRFVEHDSKRREQQLWSHLQVQAGEDVGLTFDARLQLAAERSVRTTWQQQRDRYFEPESQRKVEAAIAVVDAITGDVLAYAGWPIVSASARDVPGIVWSSNGALGSVVKPMMLVEQLQSELVGRPHRALQSLDPCTGEFRYLQRTLRCGHAHHQGGRDPVEALAESCNSFFYQCGIGLLEDGVARALQRFGLLPSKPSDPFAICWQPTVRGLAVGTPVGDVRTDHTQTLLPNRAIGYGIEASPLHVARAYAAFATGSLPSLGVRAGERRIRVPLHDVVAEIQVVQKGLAACVDSGTGKALKRLQSLGVCGKTGTAEVNRIGGNNNAWFAGYLPAPGPSGLQLCFCAVVYFVPDGQHGADAAGRIVDDMLGIVQADRVLADRYLLPTEGR